ncbi:hypothetical protein GY45DRAFT_825184 [Cubamyces sp. BRFM 1775]|nr:hypothetical protein GY45DRAFT_825184 [Cubamyces sp. BRFM 1775]
MLYLLCYTRCYPSSPSFPVHRACPRCVCAGCVVHAGSRAILQKDASLRWRSMLCTLLGTWRNLTAAAFHRTSRVAHRTPSLHSIEDRAQIHSVRYRPRTTNIGVQIGMLGMQGRVLGISDLGVYEGSGPAAGSGYLVSKYVWYVGVYVCMYKWYA